MTAGVLGVREAAENQPLRGNNQLEIKQWPHYCGFSVCDGRTRRRGPSEVQARRTADVQVRLAFGPVKPHGLPQYGQLRRIVWSCIMASAWHCGFLRLYHSACWPAQAAARASPAASSSCPQAFARRAVAEEIYELLPPVRQRDIPTIQTIQSSLRDYPGPIWRPIRACLTALTIGTVPVRAAIVGVPPTGGRRRRGGRGPND
jgi:hypothetical protein